MCRSCRSSTVARPDVGDAGPDHGGPDAGDAGRVLDAGSCQIGDGGLVPAGTWLDRQSALMCYLRSQPEPRWLGRSGWWADLRGVHIRAVPQSSDSPRPLACVASSRLPSLGCINGTAGSTCDGEFGESKAGCIGGFCNDAGRCEIDQNLGYAASCGDSRPPNPCAQGLCCMDAGFDGLVDGGALVLRAHRRWREDSAFRTAPSATPRPTAARD